MNLKISLPNDFIIMNGKWNPLTPNLKVEMSAVVGEEAEIHVKEGLRVSGVDTQGQNQHVENARLPSEEIIWDLLYPRNI